MNRRIVIPSTLTVLAIMFAALALPAGASKLLQATPEATVDPCNPKWPIPGNVGANLAVLELAVDQTQTFAIIRQTDVVGVIGKTANGFWYLIETNAGPIGWVHASGITVDPKLRSKIPVVDGTVAIKQPTPVATSEATEAATEPAAECPVQTGIVTGNNVAIKEKPDSTSKDVGANVRQTEQVVVLSWNASGTWFKIRNKDGVEGWVSSAFVAVPQIKWASIPHDYTFVEVTSTPAGQ
jgi:hypothetical protein